MALSTQRSWLVALIAAATMLLLWGEAHARAAASQPPPKHGPPFVMTGGASNVTSHHAVVHGQVTPEGPATTYYFQYGTTMRYGHRTPRRSAGSGDRTRSVRQKLSGLSPNTIYHYRIVARSRDGTRFGNDRTFKTAAATPAFTA